jgi:hypothetical protein
MRKGSCVFRASMWMGGGKQEQLDEIGSRSSVASEDDWFQIYGETANIINLRYSGRR